MNFGPPIEIPSHLYSVSPTQISWEVNSCLIVDCEGRKYSGKTTWSIFFKKSELQQFRLGLIVSPRLRLRAIIEKFITKHEVRHVVMGSSFQLLKAKSPPAQKKRHIIAQKSSSISCIYHFTTDIFYTEPPLTIIMCLLAPSLGLMLHHIHSR